MKPSHWVIMALRAAVIILQRAERANANRDRTVLVYRSITARYHSSAICSRTAADPNPTDHAGFPPLIAALRVAARTPVPWTPGCW